MGCMCCSLSSFVSIVLHALERISLCTVCAMLVCCLLLTILTVLLLGVGIGFHYCFVQNSVDAMAKAAKAAGSLRSGSGTDSLRQNTKNAIKRAGGVAHRIMRRDADDLPATNNVTGKNITGNNVTGNNITGDNQLRGAAFRAPPLPYLAYPATPIPNSTSYL